MPVPKRKRSRSRRDKRFANKGMVAQVFTKCQNCQAPLLPHQACKECGFYKGAKVLETKADRAVKRSLTATAKKASKKGTPEEPAIEESK